MSHDQLVMRGALSQAASNKGHIGDVQSRQHCHRLELSQKFHTNATVQAAKAFQKLCDGCRAYGIRPRVEVKASCLDLGPVCELGTTGRHPETNWPTRAVQLVEPDLSDTLLPVLYFVLRQRPTTTAATGTCHGATSGCPSSKTSPFDPLPATSKLPGKILARLDTSTTSREWACSLSSGRTGPHRPLLDLGASQRIVSQLAFFRSLLQLFVFANRLKLKAVV